MKTNKTENIVNALSIDVEDWYQVTLFRHIIKPEIWHLCESRVEKNVDKILNILNEKSVKATFFILGWIAKKHPSLVKKIDKEGHEIGSHGYDHTLIYEQEYQQFRQEMFHCVNTLEEITGKKVLGFRAPTYSISTKNPWVWDVLLELGFKYDSSLFPVKHDIYGIMSTPRFPCKVSVDGSYLLEFPLSTIRIKNRNIPIAGGGYLRLFPYIFIKKSIHHVNEKEKQPILIYFHPWEIDVDQPRVKTGILRRFRHYGNIAFNEHKIRRLLKDFQFTTIKQILGLE